MKRLPLVVAFVLFVGVCMSVAYWGMQFFKPPARPVAAPRQVASPVDLNLEAAVNLFGGRGAPVAVASDFQLRGIVLAGNGKDSIAILAADGKPAQAVPINTEVMPGVVVKEVHAKYILLTEAGTTRRVELPESAKGMITKTDGINNFPVPVPNAPNYPIPGSMPAPNHSFMQNNMPLLPPGMPPPDGSAPNATGVS